MMSDNFPELSPDQWESEEGGLFGRWRVDESGLPAYAYSYLEGSNPSQSKIAHWHQVGNDRFTAEAHAGGWTVPYRWEHGLTRLSGADPRHPERLSGVGAIRKNKKHLFTLINNLMPVGSPWRVKWGAGYAEWETEHGGVKVRRRVTAPFGDEPVLVVDVEISGEAAECEYEERWVVEPYAITLPAPMTKLQNPPKSYKFAEKITWLAATATSGALRKVAEAWRERYSRLLDWKLMTDKEGTLAIAEPTLKHLLPLPARECRSWRDLYPQPVCLAAGESGGSASGGKSAVEAKVDQGGVAFIGRAAFDLNPDRPARLRFIFAWGEKDELPALGRKYRAGDLPGWKGHVPRLSAPGESWMEREMSWHGYYLRSMLVKDDYFEGHLLPQGSAYSYLHGVHGAPRDYALAAVPMIYLAPARAREMILQIMRLMKPSGEIIYGHIGYGKESSAGGSHAAPTDLPIFLLWAIVEYLGATGDSGLLDERVPFYPKERGLASTVRERIELAWYYTRYRVGIGPHGILRAGSGDWNDPISLMVPNHRAFVKNGESSFNTAFTIHVLPKTAAIVENWDPKGAREMRAFSEALAKAMDKAWTGEWYLRGWDGRGGPIGKDRLFLDSNVWCLIAGLGGPERMRTLVERIAALLDDPSPIGATILDKPTKVRFGALAPGWDCNGGVWAALNGLLAWGYSLYDPDRALRNLYKQSLAAHSRAYPHVWFGIWSGPDAYNAHYAERPGETFVHPLTPMQEYPIMNSNAHALPLLALIKIAGFEPDGTKLRVSPRFPRTIGSWRLSLPLIEARAEGGKLHVEYHNNEIKKAPRIEIEGL